MVMLNARDANAAYVKCGPDQSYHLIAYGTGSAFIEASVFSYYDWAWLGSDYEGYWRVGGTSDWWHWWTPATRHVNSWYTLMVTTGGSWWENPYWNENY